MQEIVGLITGEQQDKADLITGEQQDKADLLSWQVSGTLEQIFNLEALWPTNTITTDPLLHLYQVR